MDIRAHNRDAWNRQVELGNEWTVPVTPEQIGDARKGIFTILLTPTKPVPAAWFPPLPGSDVLCLASGGGQQGPLLAAAGANVTVFDNSPAQLHQDRLVAEREGLDIKTVEGDMTDLSALADASFDLIVHPVSNNFSEHILPVWREAFRVLRPGGSLLAAFGNPVMYIFDWGEYEQGNLVVRRRLPYSDAESLSEEEKQKYIEAGDPFEFSHTLEEQIGGQLDAGFYLTGFYEDTCNPKDNDLLTNYMSTFIATRALKPRL